MNTTYKVVKNVIQHWYLPLIAGIVFLATGVLAILTPAATYISLAIIFSITFFITGSLELIFSISYRKKLDGWGWSLAAGILDVIIGLILILYPQISIITLPLFVGFVVLYRSIMSISWSIELKKYNTSKWGWLLFIGIIGIIFSFILLWNPFIAGLTVAVFTGLALMIIGIFHIDFAFELKRVKSTIEK